MLNMRLSCVIGTGAFAMGATLGILAADANAYWVDLPASVCQVQYPGTDNWTYQSSSDSVNYLSNKSTSLSLKVVCPIVDNTDLDLGNDGLTTITVRVYDGNNDLSNSQVIARACAWMASDSTSGSCNGQDQTATTAAPANDELQPPLGALGTEGETAYIYLTLPKKDLEHSVIYSIRFEG